VRFPKKSLLLLGRIAAIAVATTDQKLGVGLFCGLFLGVIGCFGVVSFWIGSCEG
jgi:hypothetical protein